MRRSVRERSALLSSCPFRIAYISWRNLENERADELDGKRHAVGHLDTHVWLPSLDLGVGKEASVAARSAC